jgi:hypothetical protein
MSDMNKLLDIMQMPTVIDKIHESPFRSWHILNYVETLLERDTPPDVVLEIVRSLRTAPKVETTWEELKDA